MLLNVHGFYQTLSINDKALSNKLLEHSWVSNYPANQKSLSKNLRVSCNPECETLV